MLQTVRVFFSLCINSPSVQDVERHWQAPMNVMCVCVHIHVSVSEDTELCVAKYFLCLFFFFFFCNICKETFFILMLKMFYLKSRESKPQLYFVGGVVAVLIVSVCVVLMQILGAEIN